MADLKDREIFAVGKWNGLDFNEADLDDIAKNFKDLSENHKVPLKFGHNKEQKITDGQPAIGWVSRVYRSGKKLYADFAGVPKIVIDAVKNRLYRTVSIELLFGVDHKGKRFNHVLDAVALLGADQPAVNVLEDLATLLATRADFSGGRRVMFETVAGNRKTITSTTEEDEMDEKEVKKLIASAIEPLEAANKKQGDEIASITKERDDFKAKAEKAERVEKERVEKENKLKVENSRKAVVEVLDEAVKDKRMTPALRETYSKQLGVEDDARVVKIDVEEVKLMCGAVKGKDGKRQGFTRDKEDEDMDGDETASQKLFTLSKKHQAEHNEKSFEVSFTRVCEANPKLHKEYLDSNLPKEG